MTKIPYDAEVERAILQRSQHHSADDRVRIKCVDLEDIIRDVLYGAQAEMKILVLEPGTVGQLTAEIGRRALLSP